MLKPGLHCAPPRREPDPGWVGKHAESRCGGSRTPVRMVALETLRGTAPGRAIRADPTCRDSREAKGLGIGPRASRYSAYWCLLTLGEIWGVTNLWSRGRQFRQMP